MKTYSNTLNADLAKKMRTNILIFEAREVTNFLFSPVFLYQYYTKANAPHDFKIYVIAFGILIILVHTFFTSRQLFRHYKIVRGLEIDSNKISIATVNGHLPWQKIFSPQSKGIRHFEITANTVTFNEVFYFKKDLEGTDYKAFDICFVEKQHFYLFLVNQEYLDLQLALQQTSS